VLYVRIAAAKAGRPQRNLEKACNKSFEKEGLGRGDRRVTVRGGGEDF